MNIRKVAEMLRQCYPNIKPYVKQNIAFLFFTECIVILELQIPLIIRFLIDDVLTSNNWRLLPYFVISLAIAIILSRILSVITNLLYSRFSANIEAAARDSLFSRIINKKISFFHRTSDGDIIDRLMTSPEHLHTIPSLHLERLISSVGTIIIVFCILFSINHFMAVIALISVPIFIIVYMYTRNLFYAQVQEAREENGRLTDFYMCTLKNIKQIKNLASENYEIAVSSIKNQNMKKLGLKYSVTGAFINNSVHIVTQINQLVVLICGAYMIHDGKMTIGTLVAFYSYLELLYQPIISIIQTLSQMNRSLVDIERYLEFYNCHDEEDFSLNSEKVTVGNDIEFSHVSFSYEGQPVVDDLTMRISTGEKILLCGRSGIGKSTVASLIKRFYECDTGNIKIGQVDIRELNLAELRKNIMYLPQDDFLFSSSIRENFKRINAQITDEDIKVALTKAQVYDEVFCSGKNGLETILEKNGAAFSGGQRRRLSISLVFASNAPIVILDEPFTGLDSETRTRLWQELKAYLRDKTVIVINHAEADPSFFHKIFEFDTQLGFTVKKI